MLSAKFQLPLTYIVKTRSPHQKHPPGGVMETRGLRRAENPDSASQTVAAWRVGAGAPRQFTLLCEPLCALILSPT